jgi:hypothetical protein
MGLKLSNPRSPISTPFGRPKTSTDEYCSAGDHAEEAAISSETCLKVGIADQSADDHAGNKPG